MEDQDAAMDRALDAQLERTASEIARLEAELRAQQQSPPSALETESTDLMMGRLDSGPQPELASTAAEILAVLKRHKPTTGDWPGGPALPGATHCEDSLDHARRSRRFARKGHGRRGTR